MITREHQPRSRRTMSAEDQSLYDRYCHDLRRLVRLHGPLYRTAMRSVLRDTIAPPR